MDDDRVNYDHERANYDDDAWDKNDAACKEARNQLPLLSTRHRVEALVEKKFGKPATWIPKIILGGYNALYRIRLEGVSPDVIVRFPQRYRAQFPNEKTIIEAATAKFVQQNTQIPVPRILFYSSGSDEDLDVGPFIIMPHIEYQETLLFMLRKPQDDPKTPCVLRADISESKLLNLYSKWAFCLVQLSKHSFPYLGALAEASDGSFSVAKRPITFNMNNMVQLANISHNDLVLSENDCRNKYIARQLFRRLAKEGRLSTFGFREDNWSFQAKARNLIVSPAPANSGSFRIRGDDLQPSNFLLNESNDVVAVIDWELMYCGPPQFVLDPPWALLLEVPEMWESAMEQAEAKERIGSNSSPFILSTHMRESWETGRFWLNYAARKSWAFDTIFWKYLDKRFFGDRDDVPQSNLWKTRVHLLNEKEREAMEPFVKKKMEDSKKRTLVEWDPEEVKEHLSKMFFD